MSSKRHKIDYRFLKINKLKNSKFIDNGEENIQRYYSDIETYKQLTQDEEQNIIERIKRGDKESDTLKTKLIGSHQPFVIGFAKRCCKLDNEQFLDLIQEGNYGMLVALENFNLAIKTKFLTYANAWIIKYMYKFLETNELIQRSNRSKTYGVDVKVREKFVKDYGYEPTSQELLDIFNEMGITIKHKEDLDQINIVSLDIPPAVKQEGVEEDDDLVIEFGEENNIVEDIDKSFDVEKIHKIMKSLNDIELEVIKKRFGFNGIEEDVTTIACEMGITVYKVNNIINDALAKLKKYKFMFE